MRDPGSAARRLAAAAAIALALTAAAGVVDNPAPGFPGPVTLPDGAPPPEGGGAGRPGPARTLPVPRLPAGEAAGPPDPAGPVLGVVGGRPAELVRLDPRTLEPLDGRRVVLPFGIYGYAWSPDRRLLALGDFDDDVVYASVDNGGEQPGYVVVSLREGRVLRASEEWLPSLLLAGHDSRC